MNRVAFKLPVLVVAVVGLFNQGILSAASPEQSRPNIVLLMGDDHGFEEVGYNGHKYLKTPVLDRMAATGLRMDKFYSAHPSCSPTRGSVLTGRHPNRYGTFSPGFSLRPQEITIAKLLKDAGYSTAHFGKWHVGPVKASSPTNPGKMGFDEWFSHDNFFEMNPIMVRNGGEPEKYEGEGSEVIIDETIKFIDKSAKNDKPFFTAVWFGSPHEPYSALEKDLKLYDNLPDYDGRSAGLTSNETGKRVKRPLRDVLRERFAEITAMDRAIGKLRDHLKDKGLKHNTIVWYCGDNGIPPSGLDKSCFRALKGKIYEGGTRVPGVIEWPARITRPTITNVNSVTSDMLPTICKLTGVELPNRPLDGIDISGVFDGTMKKRPSPICFWMANPWRKGYSKQPYIDPELQNGTTPLVKMLGGRLTRNFVNFKYEKISEEDFGGARSIVANRYKLVADATKNSGFELFDLKDDPGETTNIIEAKPKVAKKLKADLRKWQQSVLASLKGEDYSK